MGYGATKGSGVGSVRPGEGMALVYSLQLALGEFCPNGSHPWNVQAPGLWEKRISLALTDVCMHLDQFSVLRQNCLRVDPGSVKVEALP